MALRVSQCCCGCTLKTGTIIIGVLNVLSALYYIVHNIIIANTIGSAYDSNTASNSHDEYFQSNANAQYYVSIIGAIVVSVQLIVSIILIVGANNENPSLLKPWIIYSIVCVVLVSIIYFALIIVLFVFGLVGVGIALLVALVIGVALYVYFIVVVRSFHDELQGKRRPGTI